MIKECKDYGGAVDGKFMEVHLGVIMPSQVYDWRSMSSRSV
jgi:hypothetical protein